MNSNLKLKPKGTYKPRVWSQAKLLKEYDATWERVHELADELTKLKAAYEERLAQVTANWVEAQKVSDSYHVQLGEAQEEAAALKVLYLPYIKNDVDNCQ